MAISEISSKSHFKGTRSLRAEAKNVSSFAGCPVFVVFGRGTTSTLHSFVFKYKYLVLGFYAYFCYLKRLKTSRECQFVAVRFRRSIHLYSVRNVDKSAKKFK